VSFVRSPVPVVDDLIRTSDASYVQALTGLRFPVDWRGMLSTPTVGLERSTQQFRTAPQEFPLELDL